MKKSIIYFILLVTLNHVYSQIEIPYLQSFEDESFFQTNDNFHMGGIASVNHPFGGDYLNIGTVIQEAKFYSWENSQNHSTFGNSLKLTVHANDHPQLAIFPRSRAEVAINLRNNNHETNYYSWKCFIPTDNEFIEDDTGNYHIISQILSSNTWENGQVIIPGRKLLSMEYKHNNTLTTLSKRDLYLILYDSRVINKKYARINISNAVKKGQWNEFIYKIHWSENDNNSTEFGYLEMWINRKPIMVNNTVIDHDQVDINGIHTHDLDITSYSCEVSNQSGNQNIPFEFPNIAFGTNANGDLVPAQNALKLGHYRNEHILNHSIYLDDFRITTEFPPNGNETYLIPKYCDTTIEVDDMFIQCYKVPNATNYIFEFEKNGTKYYVGNGSSTTINLNNVVLHGPNGIIENILPNTTYNIRVRAMRIINGITEFSFNYTKSCEIIIPHLTKIKNQYCNLEILPIENLNIECYSIQNATNYKFHFTSATTNDEIWIDSSIPLINLRNYDDFIPYMKYNIEVRAQGSNFDFDYGDICEIRLPRHTKVYNVCNQEIFIENSINCFKIPGATNYKFRFKNSLNQLKWIDSNFPQIQIPNILYFKTGGNYEVDVRINGHDYSNVCNFSIEGVTINNSGNNLKKLNQQDSLNIYPNPFSQYIILPYFVKNTNVKIYSSTGDLVYNKNVINNDRKINLKYLPKGLYYINILSKDKNIKNIIVKK